MDTAVVTLLAEARAIGLVVHVNEGRLVARGPRTGHAIAERLLADGHAVADELTRENAEIAWRVAELRPKVPATGPIPILIVREGDFARDCCLSCGEPLATGQSWRCGLCLRAINQVLAEGDAGEPQDDDACR